MATARRVVRNFISLVTAELFSKITQFLLFVYLARFFGKETFGMFGFAIAFSGIVVILSDFGINIYLIREMSRDKKKVKELLSAAFILKVLLTILTIAASTVYLSRYDGTILYVSAFMVAFMILQTFTDLFYSVFRAYEEMHYDALSKVVRSVFLGGAIVYLTTQYQNIVFSAASFVVVELLMLLLAAFICIKKFSSLSFSLDRNLFTKVLKDSLPFSLSILFASVLVFLNTVILQEMRGEAEVGIYVAAYNLLLGVAVIPLMMGNAIYPVFSRFFVHNKPMLQFAFRKIYQYMLLMGLPLAIGIFIYSEDIIQFVYGPQYAEAAIAMSILCWAVALRFVNFISGFALAAMDKQKERMLSQGMAAGVNVTLNFILIPAYGFIGAGFASIISECLFLFTYNHHILRSGLCFDMKKIVLKLALALAAMVVVLQFVENMFIGAVVGASVYLISLFLLKIFTREDKDLIGRIVKNT